MTATEILKQYFGYDTFRAGQGEIIEAITAGRDAFGVMPTGAGKSLCYQVPAMLLPGVTLVISPLISLMRDQVQALVVSGIPAAYINSSLSEAQCARALANARAGQYKIIYVAPERLPTPALRALTASVPISLVAVDEAHCISQWGQDFRPSYVDIPQFVADLPTRPVLAAFTATATARVRTDILQTLRLQNPRTLVTGFDRPNLYFAVQQPEDKYAALAEYLSQNDGYGIVYCSTRKEVESLTERLRTDGHAAARYHAGLEPSERSAAQDDFLFDRVRVIVATNAFGMGIDKSNVRFVIHYNMPQNVESYYQEAGRAGRDGLPSDCLLFYARKDINTALFLIRSSGNAAEIARNTQLLNQMERYCETADCLRGYMLRYFGEDTHEDCGNCGNCRGEFTESDATVDAQKVLSCLYRLHKLGKHFMFTHTADILVGKSEDYTDLPTFGILKGVPRPYIRLLTNRLTALGYISDHDGFLHVTNKANEVLREGVRVTIRGRKPKASTKERRKISTQTNPKFAFSEEIFNALRALRSEIAQENRVPAYIVFTDATLVDMCQKHPATKAEMLDVSGVGEAKWEKYGERFLALLRSEGLNAKPQTAPPAFDPEQFAALVTIEDEPLQISHVTANINAVRLRFGQTNIGAPALNKLVLEAGYLEVVDGVKLPTERGTALGITTVERHSERGNYVQCLFDAGAQRECVRLAQAQFAMNNGQ
ncbi:MAG: DNA helicase RecQ [Oscillospiraceae bacterium]|jgi:ATP-dependent DNA helicase RecQ|nr:DNA helicase RecQ [Oscillospiraceae bacterium]